MRDTPLKALRAALAGLLLATAAPAQERPLGLAVATPPGPSDTLAREMAAALQAGGVYFSLRPVPGPFGPLMAARNSPEVQLAIVPGDMPAFLARRANLADAAETAGLGRDMGLVMALDARPVHLLVRGRQRGIEDLGGARIGIGPIESPGGLTAVLLLDAARVRPGHIDTRPLESAIAAFVTGRLDALFVTGPVPDPLLSRVIDEAEGVRLLPLRPSAEIPGHEPATIAARAYPFQREAVETVAVRTALVAYQYSGPTCERLRRLSEELARALPTLERHASPLWDMVRPAAVTGFAPHPCGGAVPEIVAPPPEAFPEPVAEDPAPAQEPFDPTLGGIGAGTPRSLAEEDGPEAPSPEDAASAGEEPEAPPAEDAAEAREAPEAPPAEDAAEAAEEAPERAAPADGGLGRILGGPAPTSPEPEAPETVAPETEAPATDTAEPEAADPDAQAPPGGAAVEAGREVLRAIGSVFRGSSE